MNQQQSSLPGRQRFLRRAGSERGATLAESALVITLLMTLLFGIIGFGHALYTYHFVCNAAHEATRWATARGYTCPDHPPDLAGGCPADLAGSDFQTYVTNYSTGIGLDPTKITATTTNSASPDPTIVVPPARPIRTIRAAWFRCKQCTSTVSFFRFCPVLLLTSKARLKWPSSNSSLRTTQRERFWMNKQTQEVRISKDITVL